MRRLAGVCAVAAFGWVAAAVAETKPDDIVGTWWTDGKGSQIEIYKEGEKYNGKIVWLENPNYGESDPEAGKPQRDRKNPDPARQNDPMLGLNLLKGFTFDGTANWIGGTIYDPTEGKTYKCTIKIGENGVLDVRGYIGIPALGRTTVWTRVTDEEKKATTEKTDTPKTEPAAASTAGKKVE